MPDAICTCLLIAVSPKNKENIPTMDYFFAFLPTSIKGFSIRDFHKKKNNTSSMYKYNTFEKNCLAM